MLFEDTSRCDLFTPQKSEVEKFFPHFPRSFWCWAWDLYKRLLGIFSVVAVCITWKFCQDPLTLRQSIWRLKVSFVAALSKQEATYLTTSHSTWYIIHIVSNTYIWFVFFLYLYIILQRCPLACQLTIYEVELHRYYTSLPSW